MPRFLRTWWWFLVLAVGIPMVLTPIRLAAADSYVATSVLYVTVEATDGAAQGVPATRSATTIARLARSTNILGPAITPEVTSTSVRTLARTIEARAVAGEALVDLRTPGSTSEEAARTAGAVEAAVVAAADDYGLTVEVLQPGISEIEVIRQPIVRDMIIGAWTGLLLAAGSILIVVLGFRSRRQPAAVRPTAGVVPVSRRRRDPAAWVAAVSDSALEEYRMVRLTLLRHVTPGGGMPIVVVVTGTAPPGEVGQVAYGVGSVLARAGWRVLLVEESRTPGLEVGTEGDAGLLGDEPPETTSVHPYLDRVALTSSARAREDQTPDSLEALAARVAATGDYAFVVLDLPGALRATTAAAVGRADVVLFVAHYEDDLSVAELPPYGAHPQVLTVYAQPSSRR